MFQPLAQGTLEQAAKALRTLHRGASDLQSLQAEIDFPAELVKLQAIYAGFRTADTPLLGHNRIQDAVTLIRNKRTR